MAAFTEDLEYDLAYLRKAEGFVKRRLERVLLVDEVLRQDANDDFTRLRSRMISAIHSLDPSEAELLMDVFALSSDTAHLPTLRRRREVHASKLQRSVDTVADRESPAIRRLVSALASGSYAQSPLLVQVPEMHDGIIYETTSTLLIVRDRIWEQTREHYRFTATFDEMDFLTITRSYPAEARTVDNGVFRVNTRATSGGYNDHFWHHGGTATDTPMRRGEHYDLKFTLDATPEGGTTPVVNAYRAFHHRSLLASIQVAFLGERPRTLWTYERVSHFAQPGEPNDTNRISLDERGIATLRLRDVHGGLVSGIAWHWE